MVANSSLTVAAVFIFLCSEDFSHSLPLHYMGTLFYKVMWDSANNNNLRKPGKQRPKLTLNS